VSIPPPEIPEIRRLLGGLNGYAAGRSSGGPTTPPLRWCGWRQRGKWETVNTLVVPGGDRADSALSPSDRGGVPSKPTRRRWLAASLLLALLGGLLSCNNAEDRCNDAISSIRAECSSGLWARSAAMWKQSACDNALANPSSGLPSSPLIYSPRGWH